MDDITSIILGLCDCGSSFKSWALVCWKWNTTTKRLFPKADEIFVNPIKTLMRVWDIDIREVWRHSKWFSFEENLYVCSTKPYFVVSSETLGNRNNALHNYILCPSYLSSVDDIVSLFLDSSHLNKLATLNKFFQKNTSYINDDVMSKLEQSTKKDLVFDDLLLKLITDGCLSWEYVNESIVHGGWLGQWVLKYHPQCDDENKFANKDMTNQPIYQIQRFSRCCYHAGMSTMEIWEKSVLVKYKMLQQPSDKTHVVKMFLSGMHGLVDFNYFWDKLVPTISDYNKNKLIMYSIKSCRCTWKDILMIQSQHKNKHVLLGWMMKSQN